MSDGLGFERLSAQIDGNGTLVAAPGEGKRLVIKKLVAGSKNVSATDALVIKLTDGTSDIFGPFMSPADTSLDFGEMHLRLPENKGIVTANSATGAGSGSTTYVEYEIRG